MLDVHAPEHEIHGVRDFVVHLLTITVGLLIALGLEATVEDMHHRHQRHEAEAMIRQEITDNRKHLLDSADGLKSEIDSMTKVLSILDDLSAGHSLPAVGLKEADLHFSEGPMQDSAWRTASTTGALSYMDYAEVGKFSDAYKEQDQLEAMEVLAMNDYLQLVPVLSHHAKDMTPERARDALPFARSAMGHLSGLYFIGVGTVGAYTEALK
jgi:hypothetical protein